MAKAWSFVCPCGQVPRLYFSLSGEKTLCGVGSLFRNFTVVPATTGSTCGMNCIFCWSISTGLAGGVNVPGACWM